MTDWADGIDSRNYGIRNGIDEGLLSDFLHAIIVLAIVAGALLFYSWIQSQIVKTGYEIQKLIVEEETMVHIQKKLILEEQTLLNPKRIEIIARESLGMTPVRMNQLMLPRILNEETCIFDAMALSDSETPGLNKMAGTRASSSIPIH